MCATKPSNKMLLLYIESNNLCTQHTLAHQVLWPGFRPKILKYFMLIYESNNILLLYNESYLTSKTWRQYLMRHLSLIIWQWLFCRQRQFTLRDYFAVSYL